LLGIFQKNSGNGMSASAEYSKMNHKLEHNLPRVAIITPIFKHSVLVTEAIESALDQIADFPIVLILVNDGCPHNETDIICLEYATAYPEKITYLRKLNGGLSSARNHGIRYALNQWTSIEAIYLLDADNRLRKHSISRGLSALSKSSNCDWIYPNVDMFGVNWCGDYSGDYSLLIHTTMNICEAGSLIHRRVFDSGVFFDESMRLGFEDWDFFLAAADAGFRGKNLSDFGLRYRKRPESMLADSHRDQDEIKGGMLRKHKKLMSPRTLVALEQNELPRYACFLSDTNQYLLTVDPDLPGILLTPEEYSKQLWRATVSKSRAHSPAYLVITSTRAIKKLTSHKSLHWAMWRLEQLLIDSNIATLTLSENDDDRHHTSTFVNAKGPHLDACLLMVSPRCLFEILLDPGFQWINSLTRENCEPSITNVSLSVPRDVETADHQVPNTATYHLLAQLHTLRNSDYRFSVSQNWDWRSEGIPERARAHEATRRQFGGHPTYPKVTTNSKHVGFVLPLIEFGGVEKVAINIARAMIQRGWTPHLFVLEQTDISFTAEWRDVFSSVNFLEDDCQKDWDGNVTYLGTDVSPWARHGDHGKAASLMYWLDAVINCHGAGLHGMMGRLKRHGITTVASLHLSDITAAGRPVGHTYLGLAYEHAYDAIAPCSNSLADWCHSMGVPAEKIFTIQNAPGYPQNPELTTRLVDKKLNEDRQQRPLRVLFLGRLDKQKGLLHLISVMTQAKTSAMPIDWKVVGKSIINEDDLSHQQLLSIIEPPVYDESELTALYSWADVLLLLSDYEGLPLTILEAMRQGVVVIATEVGAVSEALNDDVGYLVDPNYRVEQTIAALSELINNKEILSIKGSAAASMMKTKTWEVSASSLITQLDQKYIEKNMTAPH
jgi:glycosyltransferase involved in cell wall biosynthesis